MRLVESQDDLVITDGALDAVRPHHALVGSDGDEVLTLFEHFRLAGPGIEPTTPTKRVPASASGVLTD